MQLKTEGVAPGIDQAQFEGYAKKAKDECVISRAIAGVKDISVEATLAS